MTIYEQDADVVRWGLHLLDVCSLTNGGSPERITLLSEEDLPQIDYVEEGCGIKCSELENDEVIARTFQEELSRLGVAEASEPAYDVDDCQKKSILSQQWLAPTRSTMRCDFGIEHPGDDIEKDERSIFSLFSEETSTYAVNRADLPHISAEFILDGEVGKRLNRMVPVSLVPKINGKMPSIHEASSDHQRLLNRLRLYDLVELKVPGDGNCQFRSLSDQIYRSTEYHKLVREQVVNQLSSHQELYEGYVPMAYDDYLRKMSKPGEWGDHVTLQAASDSYGIKIIVITSFKGTCYFEILPQIQKSNRIIFLSFWAEVHYNSIYPGGDLPVTETKNRKKSHWLEFLL